MKWLMLSLVVALIFAGCAPLLSIAACGFHIPCDPPAVANQWTDERGGPR